MSSLYIPEQIWTNDILFKTLFSTNSMKPLADFTSFLCDFALEGISPAKSATKVLRYTEVQQAFVRTLDEAQ